MMRSRLFFAPLALAAALFACDDAPADAETEGAAAEAPVKAIAVATAPVTARSFTQSLEYPGVARPIEERRVAAESAGRVTKAPFEEGESIKKGALLARVDAAQAGAQVNLINTQIKSTEREYDRTKRLAAEGLATPQQLDQLEAQLDQAKASLRQARVGQSLSVARSPIAGVVARKFIEAGEFASPGAPIADIIDATTLTIEITVPESDLGFIEVGRPVRVVFPSSDTEAEGTITRRGVTVVEPSQTFPVEIQIPNESGALLAGMRARVVLPKRALEDALVIPRDAILEGLERKEVMVVEGGLARLRVVEIGPAQGNDVVVTSGLSAGDELIIQGHRNVVDGTPVRVMEAIASGAPAAEEAPE